MPSFDMVVVGSGGGPDETNLSAYGLFICHYYPMLFSQLIHMHNQLSDQTIPRKMG